MQGNCDQSLCYSSECGCVQAPSLFCLEGLLLPSTFLGCERQGCAGAGDSGEVKGQHLHLQQP